MVVDEHAKRQKKARDEDAAFGTYGGELGVSYHHTTLHTNHACFIHKQQNHVSPNRQLRRLARRECHSAPDA